jgi:hypothetical protein
LARFPAAIGANPSVDLYLHSDGAPCKNADSAGVTNRYLSSSALAAAAAKCKDTGTLNFAGGNPWVTLSTWSLPAQP